MKTGYLSEVRFPVVGGGVSHPNHRPPPPKKENKNEAPQLNSNAPLHGQLKPPSKKWSLKKSKYERLSLINVFHLFYLLFGCPDANFRPLLRVFYFTLSYKLNYILCTFCNKYYFYRCFISFTLFTVSISYKILYKLLFSNSILLCRVWFWLSFFISYFSSIMEFKAHRGQITKILMGFA